MALKFSGRTILVGAIVAWPILSRAVGMSPTPTVDETAIVSSIPQDIPAQVETHIPRQAMLPIPPKPAAVPQDDAQSSIDRIGHKIVDALRSLVQ